MFKNFIAVTAFVIGCFNYSFAQTNIERYVKDNINPVKSLDINTSGYDDLEAIGKAIGEARVVMLGEQDHGDAPAYLAKTRIIKYLHEKKGFNVLAFESDFYALNEGWSQVSESKDDIAGFLRKNIYPIWSKCDACSYLLYQYIPQTFTTEHPLQITGFDNQLGLAFTMQDLKTRLDSVLTSVGYADENKRKSLTSEIDSFLHTRGQNISPGDKAALQADLKDLKNILSNSLGGDDLWTVTVQNLISYTNLNYETRDEQMAANLEWLLEHPYEGEKVIVWAANTHIMKYTTKMLRELDTKRAKKVPNLLFKNMGTRFTGTETWKDATYVLGFTSARGKAGRLGGVTFDVPAPVKSSLESWISPEYQFAFIDFQSFNSKNTSNNTDFHLKGLTHMYYPKKFSWNKAFDGLFFIRTMYPCKPD